MTHMTNVEAALMVKRKQTFSIASCRAEESGDYGLAGRYCVYAKGNTWPVLVYDYSTAKWFGRKGTTGYISDTLQQMKPCDDSEISWITGEEMFLLRIEGVGALVRKKIAQAA